MPFKDIQKRREYRRNWARRKRKEDPEFRQKEREYQRRWAKANPEKIRAAATRQQRKLRLGVLTAYGGSPPKCACCDEEYIEFLQIDHMQGNGKEHRAKFINTVELYRSLRKAGYPDLQLRVLCANCNSSLGHYGYCPHQGEEDV